MQTGLEELLVIVGVVDVITVVVVVVVEGEVIFIGIIISWGPQGGNPGFFLSNSPRPLLPEGPYNALEDLIRILRVL